MDKLQGYQQQMGRTNVWKQDIKEYYEKWREDHPGGIVQNIQSIFSRRDPNNISNTAEFSDDYMHIFRKKSRKELVRISAAVMGIEFSYAAETAFVSPTLLKIGVEHRRMTLVWALSPLIGFFLTPFLGSLSDRCTLALGRRRPFIIFMSIGVIIGLILVPNGEYLGYVFGDPKPPDYFTNTTNDSIAITPMNSNVAPIVPVNNHPWGIFLTVLGTVLLDFNADGCQSPARAYLLDITIQEDHARGLSTFTIMAGLGGFFGYALGGIDWDNTFIGELLGGHVRAVFTLITFIFIICVIYTLTSFREIPLQFLTDANYIKLKELQKNNTENEVASVNTLEGDFVASTETCLDTKLKPSYGATSDVKENSNIEDPVNYDSENQFLPNAESGCGNITLENGEPSLEMYLKSIIYMPHSLRILCLTNLFCWMAHVCYSLYFTDFVGEAVFEGNPTALPGTITRELYEQGVRFGCWGMSLYSMSCACYSLIIEKLISRFRARRVYVYGLLVYSVGMLMMTISRNKFGVIVFSWTAGIMYSTLFTMPFILISQYHEKGQFEVELSSEPTKGEKPIRGLGTDVALVSSMVFLAQFILSLCMGTIVSCVGSTTAVVAVASTLSFFGAISASYVMYLDE